MRIYEDNCTILELEKYCARYFVTENASFVTIGIGTLANQIALRCHTAPGDEVIFDGSYHINQYESAATIWSQLLLVLLFLENQANCNE